MGPVAYFGVTADIRQCPAAVGEMVVSFKIPQSDDTVESIPIIRTPTEGVTRICGVRNQTASDQHCNDVVDQPWFRPLPSYFDSFSHHFSGSHQPLCCVGRCSAAYSNQAQARGVGAVGNDSTNFRFGLEQAISIP
jgi:hypothetical protein